MPTWEQDDARGIAWRKFMKDQLEIDPESTLRNGTVFSVRDLWTAFAAGRDSVFYNATAGDLAETFAERLECLGVDIYEKSGNKKAGVINLIYEIITQARINKERKMITDKDIEEYFTYHSPSGEQVERYAQLRNAAKSFAAALVELTPVSADQTYAVRLLRQCVMTANQAIALEDYEEAKKRPHL